MTHLHGGLEEGIGDFRVLGYALAAVIQPAERDERRTVTRIEFQRPAVVLARRHGQPLGVVAVAPQIVGTGSLGAAEARIDEGGRQVGACQGLLACLDQLNGTLDVGTRIRRIRPCRQHGQKPEKQTNKQPCPSKTISVGD